MFQERVHPHAGDMMYPAHPALELERRQRWTYGHDRCQSCCVTNASPSHQQGTPAWLALSLLISCIILGQLLQV